MEERKWDKERMKKAMEEGKEEFIDLSMKLHQLLVDFSLRALKTFEATKGETLTPVQAKQVILHELEAIKEQMSDPEFIDLVIKAAKMKYAEQGTMSSG